MSRKAVQAEITLEEGELVPGGRATFLFRLTAHEPVRIRGAHARFSGYEETKAVYTTSDGKTTTTHTATERNVVVDADHTLQGRAPEGFFRNLADGALTLIGGGDHEELARGSHDVVLEVDLPHDLPESFEAKKIKVRYDASLHLDIPAGRDFRHTAAFPVARLATADVASARPLTVRHPEDSGRGFFDKVFGPDVAMRIDLASDVVPRGGVLSGELEVRYPDGPPNVRAIVCKLLRRERSQARGHTDGHTETVASVTLPQRAGVSNTLYETFELPVPPEAIASCSGAKFTLAHELAVSLDVPWAKDPTVRIPVTLL
jgi:hypothetical protein